MLNGAMTTVTSPTRPTTVRKRYAIGMLELARDGRDQAPPRLISDMLVSLMDRSNKCQPPRPGCLSQPVGYKAVFTADELNPTGPDLPNILRQCCDYVTIIPRLRSTYDRRLTEKTSCEGREVRFTGRIVRSSETVFVN